MHLRMGDSKDHIPIRLIAGPKQLIAGSLKSSSHHLLPAYSVTPVRTETVALISVSLSVHRRPQGPGQGKVEWPPPPGRFPRSCRGHLFPWSVHGSCTAMQMVLRCLPEAADHGAVDASTLCRYAFATLEGQVRLTGGICST